MDYIACETRNYTTNGRIPQTSLLLIVCPLRFGMLPAYNWWMDVKCYCNAVMGCLSHVKQIRSGIYVWCQMGGCQLFLSYCTSCNLSETRINTSIVYSFICITFTSQIVLYFSKYPYSLFRIEVVLTLAINVSLFIGKDARVLYIFKIYVHKNIIVISY